ncbi:MAG TPA: glycosyltransferase family 39 protein [Ktedonobacteraceae bacterium]|nr:glycosyltransferase family 39 protein [Ktedonobacteraceae bacterium]
MKIFKQLKYISHYELWMFAVVAIAAVLRFILIYSNWPITDADEGNMGILALHVAYQGDHPGFFYGGAYLGPLEGYAAAPLFRLFGTSLFALRLPLVLFFVGFLISMFYLVRLLYSEKFALATVILLSLGSPDVLFLQLRASGEYPEIEMFAALICLLAVWLALSSHRIGQQRWKRLVIYGLLGLIVGIALWVDLLILPFVATAGLLLWLFCRRELLRLPGLSLLVGIIVGGFPQIYYNLTAPLLQNSLIILINIHHGGAEDMVVRHLTWVNQLTGTVFVALPMATGGSLHCPLSAIPPSGSPTPATLPCVLFQGGWTVGYLILWFIAVCLAVYAIRRYRRRVRADMAQGISLEERQEAIRQGGRLMLLASAGLTLVLYAIAPSPATAPDTSFRYLTCLLLAIPALLWPIWHSLSKQNISNWRTGGRLLLEGGLLLLVTATFVNGMVGTFMQIHTAQDVYQYEETLVRDLQQVGATRVYSDYATCNVITFLSQEKVICSAVDERLQPGYDRYVAYRLIVQAAPHPTYVFPPNTKQAETLKQRVLLASSHYRQYKIEGYVVYQVT